MARKSSTTLFYADNFDEGLRTDISADKLPQGALARANNVRFIPSGGFYLRPGTQEMTNWVPATSYKIEQFGKSMEHGVLFTKSGTKILQTKDESEPMYSIGWVGTPGYRGMFREYNSEMKYTNGQDFYLSITVGRVLTQFTNASTSIVMRPGNTDQFRTPKTGTFTADNTTDTITASAHGLSNGDRVAFTNTGGVLPAGITTATEYFVRNMTTNSFKLSTTPTGSILNITDDGTGTHTFTDGILYAKGNLITYTKKKSQTFTAEAATDLITSAAHGLINDSIIQVSNSGGALPTGLAAATNYFVLEATTDTFKLSATEGGAVIDVSGAGSGTQTFNAIKGGDTFTGAIVPTGTYEVGTIITQTKNIQTAPKATVIESIFEKIVAGGTRDAGHAEYYSVTANTTTPHNIDDFVSSGADVELFGKFGTITAMQSLLTKMYVAKDLGIEAWTGIDADEIPVREPFDFSYGVFNHDCLIPMGNKLVMYTTSNRIKTIEPDNTGANPESIINPYFDKKIKGTLKNQDLNQDNARMGYSERDELMRLTSEQDDLLNTIIFDVVTGGFSIDTGYSPSCWIEWNGSMYFGEATQAKIWKAETGFTDGASSPRMDVLTPVHFVGDRRRKTAVDQLFLTGLIKTMTIMTVEIYCDGNLHRTVEIDGQADYVSTSVFRPLGRDSIGYSPIGHSGGSPGESDGFEFAVPIDMNIECRYAQVRFLCQGTGFGGQIDSYEGVASEVSNSSATQLDAI